MNFVVLDVHAAHLDNRTLVSHLMLIRRAAGALDASPPATKHPFHRLRRSPKMAGGWE